MTRLIFILLLLLTTALRTISQTFDSTRLKELNAEYINGNLKMPDLNPDDFVLGEEKMLKLKKCSFVKTCLFNYRGFLFHLDYDSFMSALNATPAKNFSPNLSNPKYHIFNDNIIHINEYIKKASDENFVVNHIRQMAEERKLNAFDSSGQQLESFTLKKGIKETKTNRTEITFFYLKNAYIFYRNDRICTSKRFDD